MIVYALILVFNQSVTQLHFRTEDECRSNKSVINQTVSGVSTMGCFKVVK
jgi:hypothetical protein